MYTVYNCKCVPNNQLGLPSLPNILESVEPNVPINPPQFTSKHFKAFLVAELMNREGGYQHPVLLLLLPPSSWD